MNISAILTRLKLSGIKFIKNEHGVHTIEYIIIISVLTMIVTVLFFDDGPAKNALTELFNKLKDKLSIVI